MSDHVEIARRQREDRGSRSGETDAEEARLGLRGHGLDDAGQSGDQRLPVGLVQFVLHGQIDEIRVWWGLAQRYGQEGYPLEVKYLWCLISVLGLRLLHPLGSRQYSPHQVWDTPTAGPLLP